MGDSTYSNHRKEGISHEKASDASSAGRDEESDYCRYSALLILVAAPAWAGELQAGHVVVAIPGGNIEVIDPTTGTAVDGSISLGTNGQVGGCATDSSNRVRCVDYGDANVVKLALQHPHGVTQTLSVSSTPQSILYAGVKNNLILGFAGNPGLVQRYDYTGTSQINNCTGLTTDAPTTFWMDIFSDQSTIVYTSGVVSGDVNTATLRQFNMTTCGATSDVLSLALFSGQAFYGLRALPNCSLNNTCPTTPTIGSATVDGNAGYIIALGSDILRVDSSGNPIRCYASPTTAAICPTSFTGVDGESNNWRALWLTPDGNAFWTVNLATGHLFEFRISDGAVLAGPITTSAATSDDVGGVTVVGAGDAAQPTVQTASLTFTNVPANTLSTKSASFCDSPLVAPPSCGGALKLPNKVTITLNAAGTAVSDTFSIRFTEVDPVVGKSDTGLDCALESQDGTKCVIWEIEEAISPTGTGATEDLLFFWPQSPPTGTTPTLLQNLSTDVGSLVIVDEIITKKTTSCTTCHSVYTQNLLQLTGGTAVFHSGGWQNPITNIAANVFTGNSISTKFVLFSSSGNPVPTSTFNCSTAALSNCPQLVANLLRDGATPTDITTPNTGQSGTATAIFRPGADGTTWIVTVQTTGLTSGCYIFTGRDPQDRFAPFSYSTTTNPTTTILRIARKGAVPSVSFCQGLAAQIGFVAQ